MIDPYALSPVQHNSDLGIWLKRDDLFDAHGAIGAKARHAYQIISTSDCPIITCGSADSRQCEIISTICNHFDRPCECIMPHAKGGKPTDIQQRLQTHPKTTIKYLSMPFRAAQESVGKKDADALGGIFIPSGLAMPHDMTCQEDQVLNIPKEVERIVIICGSGVNLACLLNGMSKHSIDKPVLAVCVGGKQWQKNLPTFVRYPIDRTKLEFVQAPQPYATPVDAKIGDIVLDPIYEAKAFQFLRPGDLFWILGKF